MPLISALGGRGRQIYRITYIESSRPARVHSEDSLNINIKAIQKAVFKKKYYNLLKMKFKIKLLTEKKNYEDRVNKNKQNYMANLHFNIYRIILNINNLSPRD